MPEAAKTETTTSETSTSDLESLISAKVAEAVAAALPAVLSGLNQGKAADPIHNPSASVTISTAPANAMPLKYLKHYKLDDTVSGKYQMYDIDKLESGVDLPDAVMKGQWIHFVGDNFYATKEVEVKNVEWMIRTNGLKAYEAEQTEAIIPCPVSGCGKRFGTNVGLSNHLKATHGLESGRLV